MVDWREVERLRAKGLDWDSIADNPKVAFTAPDGVEDSGRALKSLYLTRRSQRARGSRGGSATAEAEGAAVSDRRTGRVRMLWSVGLIFTLIFVIWSIFTVALPSLVGALVPFVPYVLAGLVVGLVLLGAAFVLGVSDLRASFVKPVVVGVAAGLVISAGVAGIAYERGFLVLNPAQQIQFGWEKAPNSPWTSNGKPVVLFVGSAACPYCSISSWAFVDALRAYGSLPTYGTTTSSPTDTFANTPAITLYDLNYASNYISLNVQEDANNQAISIPPLPPTENSFFHQYNSGGSIPFFVIGGTYIFTGSLLGPQEACQGGPSAVSSSTGSAQCVSGPYSPAAFQGLVGNSTSQPYGAVIQQSWLLEAVMWKALGQSGLSPPLSVSQDSNVRNLYDQLS